MYMEESVLKHCSRCNKSKNLDEFTELRKLCNECIEDKREYHRCKRAGIERVKEVKEPTIKYKLRNYYCEVCEYELRLCKKKGHEQTLYHQDRLRRKEHPEEFENEEKPDRTYFENGKEYFICNKCKRGVMSSLWARHCASLDHLGKKSLRSTTPNF